MTRPARDSSAGRATKLGQPAYMVESLSNALVLLNAIRDQGSLRLKDAASEIDVAESTAHRLLTTLIYHGFVEQDSKRLYRPGPALGIGPSALGWKDLKDACFPEMGHLAALTEETVNLVVRTGPRARVIACVESTKLLRCGNRQGHVPLARISAGGRALLAHLDDDEIKTLHASGDAPTHTSDADLTKLLHDIRIVRRTGFAVVIDEAEVGLAAVAMALRSESEGAQAAVVVALPKIRIRDAMQAGLLERMRLSRAVMETQIQTLRRPDGPNPGLG